jgi:hypothetical protein
LDGVSHVVRDVKVDTACDGMYFDNLCINFAIGASLALLASDLTSHNPSTTGNKSGSGAGGVKVGSRC